MRAPTVHLALFQNQAYFSFGTASRRMSVAVFFAVVNVD